MMKFSRLVLGSDEYTDMRKVKGPSASVHGSLKKDKFPSKRNNFVSLKAGFWFPVVIKYLFLLQCLDKLWDLTGLLSKR